MKALRDVAKDNNEILYSLLNGAKVTRFVEDKMTLSLINVFRAKHFEKFYKKKFEDSVSKVLGRKITVEIEMK